MKNEQMNERLNKAMSFISRDFTLVFDSFDHHIVLSSGKLGCTALGFTSRIGLGVTCQGVLKDSW